MKILRIHAALLTLTSAFFFTGCPDILEALLQAASYPKIVYVVNTADPASPVVRFAAIQPEDFAFETAVITDFGAPGRITGLKLSPAEDYAAITHIEEAGVTEARVMVYTNTALRESFETDNTLSADIEALCGAGSDALAHGYDILPELFPPNDPTSGGILPEVRFSDSPNNEIGVVNWIDTDSLLLRLSVELQVLFIAADGSEIDFGILRDETFYLTYSRNSDATWASTTCDNDIPPGSGGFVQSRDVSLSDPVGDVRTILLDGAPLLNSVGSVLVPSGALRVDGPYL